MNTRQRNARCNRVGELIIWSVCTGIIIAVIIVGTF